MPENDLKLICDAIPCSSSGTVSTQATNIYKGITGETVEFDISAGAQPTLFTPILSQDGLRYSANYNTDNGAFCSDSDLVVTLDGIQVPITGTLGVGDDGKELKAVLSKQNFTSSMVTKTVFIPDADPGVCSTTYVTTSEVNPNSPLMLVLGKQKHAFLKYTGLVSNLINAIEISSDDGVTWRHPTATSFSYYLGLIAIAIDSSDFSSGRPVLNLTGDRFRIRFCHIANDAPITIVPWVNSLDRANVQFFSRATPGTLTGLGSDLLIKATNTDSEYNYNGFTWTSLWTDAADSWIEYTPMLGSTGRFNCVVRWVDTKEKVSIIHPYTDIPSGSTRELSITLEPFN